jgi:hypothetical protein
LLINKRAVLPLFYNGLPPGVVGSTCPASTGGGPLFYDLAVKLVVIFWLSVEVDASLPAKT